MKLKRIFQKRFVRYAPAVLLAVLGPLLFAAALVPTSNRAAGPAPSRASMDGQHRSNPGMKQELRLSQTVKTNFFRIASLLEKVQ